MGKQINFGQYRGKVGDSVGYKVANAKRTGTIGIRPYVAEVTNPKTVKQAEQRMHVRACVNFYRGLQTILDHSWEGVKYGSRSRSYFLKIAQSKGGALAPYVDKGTSRFIPGDFPVSLGSVGLITSNISFMPVVGAQEYKWRWESLYGIDFDDMPDTDTWGSFSQKILSVVPGMQNGDEITFIGVIESAGYYIPMHAYLVIDTSSLDMCWNVFANAGVALNVDGVFDFLTSHDYNVATIVQGKAVAAAIIISRHPSRNRMTWLRSSSRMVVADDFMERWRSPQRFQTARATYMPNAVQLTSDYLLNQAERDE